MQGSGQVEAWKHDRVEILHMTLRQQFDELGYVVLEPVFPTEYITELQEVCDRLIAVAPQRGGFRHGLQRSKTLRELSHAREITEPVAEVLGESARAVKLTGFDKTPQANWKVPWHQDLTITVREKRETPGFGPWSIKDGLPHVQPPAELLRAIVAVRLHLDDTGRDNGALHVIPGSHRHGRLNAEQIRQLRCGGDVGCPVAAGGMMLMSPLLLHASYPATVPGHRRVLHFEYTAAMLPNGLDWA